MATETLGHPTQASLTVVAGNSRVIEINRRNITVAAIPVSGGTALVEFAVIDKESSGGTNWFEWTSGSVSANTIENIPYDIALIRITATTENADFEIRL